MGGTHGGRVDMLIIDDFALQSFDAADTTDVYELIVERAARRPPWPPRAEPVEWLRRMAHPLLARCAINRLQWAAYEVSTVSPTIAGRSRASHPLTRAQPLDHHNLADAARVSDPVPRRWAEPPPSGWGRHPLGRSGSQRAIA